MKTIIEPFRIKVVEPIRMTTGGERERILRDAGFNPFLIHADDVLIDLLTDSGTGAMSSLQWSGVMRGDESYAGARSWFALEAKVRELTGFEHILPTHQGRASERILFELLGGPGKVVPNNNHFDTTRANVEHSGAQAVDLVIEEGRHPRSRHPFKGNMDLARLEALLEAEGTKAGSREGAERGARRSDEGTKTRNDEHNAAAAPRLRARVPLVMCTITNNSGGGQPVSLENLRGVRALCDRYGVPFFLDACRFAENAYFIKLREPGQQNRSVREIVREIFDLADGATISAKKDGLVNIGGLLLIRDKELMRRADELLILTEGYVTYGGLAGRDLEAMAQGFEEVVHEDYLQYRIRSTAYLGEKLLAAGIQIVEPPGGHAIYIDAAAFCPHIPPAQFPGQALVCGLYRHAGIRAVEIGSVMFGGPGRPPPAMELVRLAIPRRVYTQSHIDYVVEAIIELYGQRDRLRGLEIIEQPPTLRHFTARFREL
ncbi:MAG: tryptophanase [Phycisphaerae bacterium]|nr:tryptophanase [Phycisphaerae bacterium]MCZ2400360.1 tryptophanase [Phycisphaerae bacterium]NUQ50021.1 tryptophanase [Phycisphaerae bacterium]